MTLAEKYFLFRGRLGLQDFWIGLILSGVLYVGY